jgi:hypothetical protein
MNVLPLERGRHQRPFDWIGGVGEATVMCVHATDRRSSARVVFEHSPQFTR